MISHNKLYFIKIFFSTITSKQIISNYLKISVIVGNFIFLCNIVNGFRLCSYYTKNKPMSLLFVKKCTVVTGISLWKALYYGLVWPLSTVWIGYTFLYTNPRRHFKPLYSVLGDKYDSIKKD